MWLIELFLNEKKFSPEILVPKVPIEADFQPANCQICLQNSTTEVLPFVPVTPIILLGFFS